MITKHQHYVPQFYLRQFADERERIWAYDKVEDRAFCTTVRNVAGERYFYDSEVLERKLGDRQAMEKFLREMEGHYAACMQRLLHRMRTGGYRRLHPETRSVIANFAAVQLLRTPEQRIKGRQITESILAFFRTHPNTERLIAEAEASLATDALREGQVAALMNVEAVAEMTKILASHIWVFARRRPEHSFYTSDAPISTVGRVPRPGRGNEGIASKGVEIHVPISHDFALTLYERTAFASSEHLDGTIIDLSDPENMVYSRNWAVTDSTRYVFCLEDDFDLARTICKEDTSCRDMNRRRIASNHDTLTAPQQ